MANAAALPDLAGANVDSDELADLGYRQELHRSLGAFASFAAGFSFVSILTTTFQLFALGFSFGGPAFVWTWPIVFVGQFSVALVFAELSSRYPVSGSIYQWSRRISSELLGWFAGWYMMLGYIVSVSAIAIALQTVLPSVWSGFQIVGGSPALTSQTGATNAILIGSIVIAVSTVIGNIGVSIMSRITRIGVTCELIGVGLMIILFFAHAKRSPGAVFHTNGVAGHGSYVWPFLISALMACYVMYGFDSAGELSEETNDPRRAAPRGIIRAMLASGVGGALILVGALLAAPSLTSPQLGTDGLAYVVQSRLGTGLGKVLLVDVSIAILSAALAIQASASRVMFSMARDDRLPFSRRLAHVSEHRRAPALPNVVVGVFAILLLVVNLGQAALFTDITGVAVVIVYLAYLGVTVPRLVDRVRPGHAEREAARPASFSLGRWGLPVNIVAVAFGAFFLVDIGWPRASVYGTSWYLQYFSLLFVGGFAVIGAAAHAWLRRSETRPQPPAPQRTEWAGLETRSGS